MIGRFAVVALLGAGLVGSMPGGTSWAKTPDAPATQPATPATRPAPPTKSDPAKPMPAPAKPAPAKPAPAKPTPQGDAKPEAKLPTPGELWDKITKATAAATEPDKRAKVAFFDLDSPVVEKPAGFSLFGDNATITVQTLVDRLHQARDDKGVKGVVIALGATGFNLAQAQEIRDALSQLKKVGKRSFIYSDGYDTAAYVAASGASDICLLGGGEIMIPGIGLETMFYKGLFDKLGVQADYVQIGEYKGAEEPYTRSAASDELRGELNKITDSLYHQVIEGISRHRNLSKEAVEKIVDQCILTGETAKAQKLVDHLIDRDELGALMHKELGADLNVVADYGVKEHERLDFSNPISFFQSLTKKPAKDDKPAVALISADGVIVDGEAEEGPFGGGGNVGSESLRKAFKIAAKDDNIKAIVLRIDSPGGSALASEVMWQAARHAADKKPLIISIGSMAASGGYYLASSGDYIFADPSAIVGSIGVVGGKFVLKGLYEKLGLNTETFSRGENAALFSMNQPFTDKQKKMVRAWMTQTYVQFTQRVMTYRAGKIKDIDKVARGRVFIAQQAKDLGMVDALGGVDAAITYAAKEAELKEGEYEVKLVPTPKTLADLFNGNMAADNAAGTGTDDKLPFKASAGTVRNALSNLSVHVTVSQDSVLRLLPAGARRLLCQQIELMQMLDRRPILLVSPFVTTLK